MEKTPGHSFTLGSIRQFPAGSDELISTFDKSCRDRRLPPGRSLGQPAIHRCCHQSRRRRAVGSSPYHHSFGFRPFPLLLDEGGCECHQCSACYDHPYT